MYCSDEDYIRFFNRWWADADAESRREDPAIWDDWDEARWRFIRRLCREQHQGRYPDVSEKPQSCGPWKVLVEVELGAIILLREMVRNRIRTRLGHAVPKSPPPPSTSEPPASPPKGSLAAQLAESNKQCSDLGLAWGPEAVNKAPIDVAAPVLQLGLLQGSRFARRDIIDGFIDPTTEYGLDKPTALAHCDAIEAEARLAVLGWTSEPLRTQDKDALRAWKERLARESQAVG
jgi:hypothetical protein